MIPTIFHKINILIIQILNNRFRPVLFIMIYVLSLILISLLLSDPTYAINTDPNLPNAIKPTLPDWRQWHEVPPNAIAVASRDGSFTFVPDNYTTSPNRSISTSRSFTISPDRSPNKTVDIVEVLREESANRNNRNNNLTNQPATSDVELRPKTNRSRPEYYQFIKDILVEIVEAALAKVK